MRYLCESFVFVPEPADSFDKTITANVVAVIESSFQPVFGDEERVEPTLFECLG